MREIVFRAKRKDNGEWVYGSLLIQAGERINKDELTPAEYRILGCRGENHLVDPETVGQYTGLKDKNGTKIFEGDILRLWGDGYDWNGIVVFGRTTSDEDNLEDYGYGWQLDKITKDEPVYTKILLWVEAEADGIDCEIIGNIHDNPELLNK